jgi:hypothetical protein
LLIGKKKSLIGRVSIKMRGNKLEGFIEVMENKRKVNGKKKRREMYGKCTTKKENSVTQTVSLFSFFVSSFLIRCQKKEHV